MLYLIYFLDLHTPIFYLDKYIYKDISFFTIYGNYRFEFQFSLL